jgi:lysozyme
MKFNDAGLALLKEHEGCRLTSYQDSGGTWTIGYGITGPNIKARMTITQAEADSMLEERLDQVIKMVDRLVTYPISSNQFSALVDFAFNEGVGSLDRSTLLAMVNDGQVAPAADQFVRWTKVNGVVLKGLQSRRLAEKKLFETPDPLS